MRLLRLLLPLILLFCLSQAVQCQSLLSLTGPERREMTEGHSYFITWTSDPTIKTVRIVVYGVRTPRGSRSRGRFTLQVARVTASRGEYEWTVPWIDSIGFAVKLKGYNTEGKIAAAAERNYRFRTGVMANRFKDGIYLDLHKSYNQRLYVQKNRRLIRAYISSSSEKYRWVPRNVHPKAPHDHAGVFKVLGKERDHMSREFHVHMRFALRYLSGHFIHATSRNLYRLLGRAASHGCNRLTRRDALELYWTTRIGTRVEVIGPKG